MVDSQPWDTLRVTRETARYESAHSRMPHTRRLSICVTTISNSSAWCYSSAYIHILLLSVQSGRDAMSRRRGEIIHFPGCTSHKPRSAREPYTYDARIQQRAGWFCALVLITVHGLRAVCLLPQYPQGALGRCKRCPLTTKYTMIPRTSLRAATALRVRTCGAGRPQPYHRPS